jgi:hypothetical protein
VMNWKGCGRKRSWPNFKVLSQHLPDVLRKTMKTSISRSQDRDLNSGPPEYEAGVLRTQPRRSVPRCNQLACM